MLSKLLSLLEPLDVLRCNGIILPKTQEEWQEALEVLQKCSNVLKDITNLIQSKGETYCTVNAELKNFAEIYDKIENVQKKCVAHNFIFSDGFILNQCLLKCTIFFRLEEALCNLQVLILKNASLSLTCNETE